MFLPAPARLACLALLLAAAPARAVVLCVDTPAELLAAANLGADSDEVIDVRIVQGSYALSQPIQPPQQGGHLRLRGGYLPGCASRDPHPANTVLDFTAAGANGFLDVLAWQKFTLTWLTLQDAAYVRASAENETFGGPAIDVHNTILRRIGPHAATDHLPPVAFSAYVGYTSFRNNLLYELVSPGPGCGIWFGHDGSASVVVNNTFGRMRTAANGVADVCFIDPYVGAEPGAASVYNNIVWSQPVPAGLWAAPGFSMTLVHNTAPYYAGPAPAFQAGASTADPLFVNPDGGAYWLPDVSPAVNSGTTFVPDGLDAVDLTNTARHVGSAPDRGAYESAFDDTQTFLVTSTADAGPGSLRQALSNANATVSAKQVKFQIPGACPHVIALQTALPPVTVPVQVLGRSQPGSTANASETGFDANLCVLLHDAGAAGYALRVPANAGNASLRVEGLGFSNFGIRAIDLEGGHDHVIAGNQFGGQLPASPLFPNHTHVYVGTGVQRYTVGGTGPANRNLFAASQTGVLTSHGVWIALGANGGRVVNNVFGLQRGLDAASPNRVALRVDGSSTEVRGNLIAGNSGDGLLLLGGNNVVQQNIIGLQNAHGTFGNGGAGVRLGGGAAGNAVGSLSLLQHPVADGNHVAHNAGGGVWLQTLAGSGNTLRGNRLHDNGAWPQIDLGNAGPDPNDAGDADTGPNTRLNHPVVTAILLPGVPPDATQVPVQVSATLATTPGSYVVDLYGGDSCVAGLGEARDHLGHFVVNVPAAGSAALALGVVLPRLTGYSVSATATSAAGSTSELGACFAVPPPTPAGPLLRDGFESP